MNYYEHHIGDFAEATAHLTFVEDAAYSRIIRKYYATERPMPADIKAVQRLVGARSKEEREAVESVLREFFVLEADGWHQKRCDADLQRYLNKQDKARASANARWAKPHTERNANASPPHMQTDCERNANASETHDERNALQSPVPSNQTPDPKTVGQARKRATRKAPPDFDLTADLREWAKTEAPGIDIERETRAFLDHEFKTPRTDWLGTWRNWMRKAEPVRAARNGNGGYAAERNRAFAGEFADDAPLILDEERPHDIALPHARG